MSINRIPREDESANIAGLTLTMRRTVDASASLLYDAWTNPRQLLDWWGPRGVRCVDAEVDLRVGGHYRIGNQLPDGRTVWITGVFETVVPDRLLIYSWAVDAQPTQERVTVRFEPRGNATEVVVVHERIVGATVRGDHERGWEGCLSRLARLLESSWGASRSSDSDHPPCR